MLRSGIHRSTIATLLVLYLGISTAYAKTYSIPVVYSDNYIDVRSSVLFTEEETFHLGDALYLAITLEFNSDRVGIINLDETLLTDSWGESPWIVHRGAPQISSSAAEKGLTRLHAFYEFQIVSCPDPGVICPGGKLYPLGDITLGVELKDDNGRVVSTEDIGFRPSPGFVGLPSALTLNNGRLESFNLYFPSRAFGLPIAAGVNPDPSLLLFVIGLVLVSVMVVAPTARTWLRHRVTKQMGILGNRWEHVLDRLQDETLADDEFWEGVRVAITWYCHDEFKINPLQWSTDRKDELSEDVLNQLRAVFIKAMHGSDLSAEQRKEIVKTLAENFIQS